MTCQQETKLTLAQIVSNFSTWESKFAWQPVMSSTSSVPGNVASAPVEADNKKLVNQIASMSGQMKQMQQQARDSRDNRSRTADRSNGKGKGDGNKGGRSVERTDYRSSGKGEGNEKKLRSGPRCADHQR